MGFRVPTSCSVLTTAVRNPESSSSYYEENQSNRNTKSKKIRKEVH
jgi:hypothetical protein